MTPIETPGWDRSKTSAGFRYIGWARDEAAPRCHNRADAHVILALATYANEKGEAWPSMQTLARVCGLKVKAADKGSSSSIAASLKRLRDAGLIETIQRGNGMSAVHRLLTGQPSARTEGQPSATPEGNYQRNCHTTNAEASSILGDLQNSTSSRETKLPKSLPRDRKADLTDDSLPAEDEWDRKFAEVQAQTNGRAG